MQVPLPLTDPVETLGFWKFTERGKKEWNCVLESESAGEESQMGDLRWTDV